MTNSSAGCQLAVFSAALALCAGGWMLGSAAPPLPPARPATPAAAELVIAGATLDAWRERMGRLDLQDPASVAVVPGLIALAEAPAVPWFTRRQAALTLGRLGPLGRDAVPHLIRLLDDPGDDPEIAPRLWSLKALALFGPLAAEAAPSVRRLALDRQMHDHHRLAAIECLSQMGGAAPEVAPTLIELVQTVERDPQTTHDFRRAAVEALGYAGPAAAVAVPVLVRTLDDPDESLRREAATTLSKLGPRADAAAPALLERLAFDDAPAVRDAAATALGAIGPQNGAEVVSLLQLADAEDRRRVLGVLARWKHGARPWAAEIAALARDADGLVRLAALEATWQITGDGRAIAAQVAAEVAADERLVRREAVRLLDRLGAAGAAARGTLEALRDDPRAEVRTAARKALAALERATPTDAPPPGR